MIRSHHTLPWRCCGIVHPAEFRHCPWCGSSVVSVDRILFRWPLSSNNGDLVICVNATPDEEELSAISNAIIAAKRSFRQRRTDEEK